MLSTEYRPFIVYFLPQGKMDLANKSYLILVYIFVGCVFASVLDLFIYLLISLWRTYPVANILFLYRQSVLYTRKIKIE